MTELYEIDSGDPYDTTSTLHSLLYFERGTDACDDLFRRAAETYCAGRVDIPSTWYTRPPTGTSSSTTA